MQNIVRITYQAADFEGTVCYKNTSVYAAVCKFMNSSYFCDYEIISVIVDKSFNLE